MTCISARFAKAVFDEVLCRMTSMGRAERAEFEREMSDAGDEFLRKQRGKRDVTTSQSEANETDEASEFGGDDADSEEVRSVVSEDEVGRGDDEGSGEDGADEVQYSKSAQRVTGQTKKSLIESLRGFMMAGSLGRNVIVVDTASDLEGVKNLVTALTNKTAMAFTTDGKPT